MPYNRGMKTRKIEARNNNGQIMVDSGVFQTWQIRLAPYGKILHTGSPTYIKRIWRERYDARQYMRQNAYMTKTWKEICKEPWN